MITALITTSNYFRAGELMERLSGSVYRSIYLRYTHTHNEITAEAESKDNFSGISISRSLSFSRTNVLKREEAAPSDIMNVLMKRTFTHQTCLI